jgi:anti-sigma regulatory factor (Ser/Thr protein kinase)
METDREWVIERGDLRGVSSARREFSRYLSLRCGDDPGCDDAALIFGELVANAVKCARSSVSVQLRNNGCSELRVIDDGDCFERPNVVPQPLHAQSGRGLYIVSMLARNLSVDVGDHHCEVTAELPIHI